MRKILMTLALTLPLFASGEPPQPARFEKSFTILREILKKKDRKAIVDGLVASGRGPLFSIEGLTRVYEANYNGMSSLRSQSKAFENKLGQHIDLVDHVASAKAMGVEISTIRQLQKLVRDNLVETEVPAGEILLEDHMTFMDFLLHNDWIESDKPRLAKWEKKIAEAAWEGPKKDREYVLDFLIDATQDLRKEEWNMGEIQEGMHDFRRRIRWLSIYLQSLRDLVVLDYPSLPKFDGVLTERVANGKYSRLSDDVDKLGFPILFPHALYLELTKAIEELGFAKDTAEAMYQWLPDALMASGEASTRTQALRLAATYVKKLPNYRNPRPTADKIYAYLRRNDHRFADKADRGVLVALKERLKGQRGWRKKDCRRELEEQAELTPAGKA